MYTYQCFTGIQKGLKIRRGQPRGGSPPPPGTIDEVHKINSLRRIKPLIRRGFSHAQKCRCYLWCYFAIVFGRALCRRKTQQKCGCLGNRRIALSRRRRRGVCDRDRQQHRSASPKAGKPAVAIQRPPLQHLVYVDPVLARNPRTDQPGASVLPTLRRRSAALRRRRFPIDSISASTMKPCSRLPLRLSMRKLERLP